MDLRDFIASTLTLVVAGGILLLASWLHAPLPKTDVATTAQPAPFVAQTPAPAIRFPGRNYDAATDDAAALGAITVTAKRIGPEVAQNERKEKVRSF